MAVIAIHIIGMRMHNVTVLYEVTSVENDTRFMFYVEIIMVFVISEQWNYQFKYGGDWNKRLNYFLYGDYILNEEYDDNGLMK